MKQRSTFITVLIGLIPLLCLADAMQSRKTDATTGVVTWETHAHGVTFSLTQILPDQARAFYVNRGFTLQQVESYATSCVFMTVLRNEDARGRIHFVRNNWSIVSGGEDRPMETVAAWLQRLKKNKAGKSALIAFR